VLSALANSRRDVVRDFRSRFDAVALSRQELLSVGASQTLATGAIAPNQFVLGSVATTANHRFIYNQNTGSFFFDADGSGRASQILIAQFSNRAAMSARDVLIVA